MTTTRAIANDIGAAPISDHSCATPSNHSGMVVFPPSGRIRRYLRPRKLLFYPTPDRELAMRLENHFIDEKLEQYSRDDEHNNPFPSHDTDFPVCKTAILAVFPTASTQRYSSQPRAVS